MTEIYVVSGFLGAGKTTLIQKMLKEAFENKKVVLIENDFGEISVDAALMKAGSVEVREISAGCICCSLAGDFVKAMRDLVDRFAPDVILIEPSGVGKLSDIAKACADARVCELVTIKTLITVVDVKRCQMYLDNFGEFFEDQIVHAGAVWLSRADEFPDKVAAARQLVTELNANAVIFDQPCGEINTVDILDPQRYGAHNHTCTCGHDHEHETEKHDHTCACGHDHGAEEHDHTCTCGHDHGAEEHDHTCTCGHDHEAEEHDHTCACGHDHGAEEHDHTCACGHDHGAEEHDHTCTCGHNHAAEEVFDTVTLRTDRVFDQEDLYARMMKVQQTAAGTILRAKGIVRGEKGYLNLQYLPGDIKITPCEAGGDMLCIIGEGLNKQELVKIFNGE